MKRYILGGVRESDDNYVFDYTIDLPDDIINVVPPQIYKTAIGNHIYWFGYKFNDNASSKQRSAFIHYMKGLGKTKISDHELTQFIEIPLGALDNMISTYEIDCVVYPISNRSKLVNKMISTVGRLTSHNRTLVSYQLVKSIPTDISFDWELFESENSYDDNKYTQMKQYVLDVLLPKIHALDYFSLAANVKPKYRRYIKDYLGFISQEDMEQYARAQGNNILVIDDVNTSGATIDEILRILKTVNKSAKIFVFTLIGNHL